MRNASIAARPAQDRSVQEGKSEDGHHRRVVLNNFSTTFQLKVRAVQDAQSCRAVTSLCLRLRLQPETCSYARFIVHSTWTCTSTIFPSVFLPSFFHLNISTWQSSRFGCCFHELRPLTGRGESTVHVQQTYTSLFIFSFVLLLRCTLRELDLRIAPEPTMIAVKTRAADGGWHVAIAEGTVSFGSDIWEK